MRVDRGMKGPEVAIEDLMVSYYKKDILMGLSLKVGAGEIVTLVGANGSGKSTLLKTVAGVMKARSGCVRLNGDDLTNKKSDELAHMGVAFLMQGGLVFPSLTVTEHLQLANQAMKRDDFNRRADAVWSTFPVLHSIRRSRAGFLSGGEKQMLGFSMLLMKDAKLWLLDEPTGNLASEAADILLSKVEEINDKEGITVLLAEQNLTTALRISNRAFVLRDGLAYERSPESILNSSLEELFFGESLN